MSSPSTSMPLMDGVTFLRKIMALRPMPRGDDLHPYQAGAEVTLERWRSAPSISSPSDAGRGQRDDHARRRAAGEGEVCRPIAGAWPPARCAGSRAEACAARARDRQGGADRRLDRRREALKDVLMGLPSDCPPILVTQHMPARFTTAFANRLNKDCPMRVSEAQHGDVIEAGHVYIAPGSASSRDRPSRPALRVLAARWAHGLRPSAIGGRSVSVGRPRAWAHGDRWILTGMGKDGAEGMLEFRRAGATTLGQTRTRLDLRQAAGRIRIRSRHASILAGAHGGGILEACGPGASHEHGAVARAG